MLGHVGVVLLLATSPGAQQPVDFAHDVLPVLKARCAKCHTAGTYKGKVSMDTREDLIASKALQPGNSGKSKLIARITEADPEMRMPPAGDPLSDAQIATLRRWIDEGAAWQEGLSLAGSKYVPKLALRRPELPPAQDGRSHPLDRIIDAYLSLNNVPRPQPLDDGAFVRRAYLDIIGVLPTPQELFAVVDTKDPARHEKLVGALLARDRDYAEHWLTFWNDHLRNDYAGPGYIDGGRKQITGWLYQSLLTNKPYDQFTRELISPGAEAEGFIYGIKWRGNVNASQVREVQFAQNVGQVFLGVNLKCASCHDSFIDDWKLDDAYGMAAIISDRPLEIHRCDKATGKTAAARFIYPELGQIDAALPPPQRLAQLADLLTKKENGRFARTIVNRLWHRLMGRGIVYPVDVMSNEPWSEDLLDYLAVHLVDNRYDLKKTIELICTSQAYRSQSMILAEEPPATSFVYRGPIAKRLTAEQFIDAVWQITGTGPTKPDAPIATSGAQPQQQGQVKNEVAAKWIWSDKNASSAAPGNDQITLRRKFTLPATPKSAIAVVTCDNAYTLFINGKPAARDDNWQTAEAVAVEKLLRQGENEIVAVARNLTDSPNPAGFYFALNIVLKDDQKQPIASDAQWQWTRTAPQDGGTFKTPPDDWKAAEEVANQNVWGAVAASAVQAVDASAGLPTLRVRASLVNADPLMRSLGRPNREQVVTTRPEELTTLQALDLANGQALYDLLMQGARNIEQGPGRYHSKVGLVKWVYVSALGRVPTKQEEAVAMDVLGERTQENIADLLWTVLMLPEFQLVR
jgi:mono/diheme cytochrome c family protein